MTEVRFYHLQRERLEQVLPQLLEKTLERGWRAVVMAGSDDRVEALNVLLWNYTREGFLPHGSRKDSHPDRQPIWLTERDENPNGANVLFLVDGANSTRIAEFQLCCEVFDGRDDFALVAARNHWRMRKEAGFDLTYWQQTERGNWGKKAESSRKEYKNTE
ncbi:MAG: DNA polymerase III subunit chi [Pseudomonadota bacterium]|nr:DNA polymerase III subunit chi [Pseudomonadota bacterium]